MDFMVFVRASQNCPARDFQKWYLGTFAPALADRHPDLGRHVINVTEEGPEELRLPHDSRDPAARYDVVAQIACTAGAFRSALETMRAELASRADVLHAYRVSDTVVLDKEPSRPQSLPEALPGFKLLRELLFYDDMPDSVAKRCWAHHARLALKVHVGMTRYVQHWVEERMTPDSPPTRGISELYFPTREDLVQRYYESPRGRDEVVHDTAHFIERRLPRVYSREHVLAPPRLRVTTCHHMPQVPSSSGPV